VNYSQPSLLLSVPWYGNLEKQIFFLWIKVLAGSAPGRPYWAIFSPIRLLFGSSFFVKMKQPKEIAMFGLLFVCTIGFIAT
jgi:hypothetical protein